MTTVVADHASTLHIPVADTSHLNRSLWSRIYECTVNFGPLAVTTFGGPQGIADFRAPLFAECVTNWNIVKPFTALAHIAIMYVILRI